jgi:hypothetical protein
MSSTSRARSNRKSPYTTTTEPTETTAWTGWVAFAAFVMMMSGALTIVSGFIAVINHNWSTFNNNGVPYGTVYWWGWWTLFVGLIVLTVGALLLRGSMFARTIAVFVAGGSLISQFLTVHIAPLWSLTVIVIDMLVIWAVMVHGKEMKDI